MLVHLVHQKLHNFSYNKQIYLCLFVSSPVKTQSVQKCRQTLHDQQNGDRENSEDTKHRHKKEHAQFRAHP